MFGATAVPTGGDALTEVVVMAAAPYLVALALIEQEGRRALPLAGRSLSAEAAAAEEPTKSTIPC